MWWKLIVRTLGGTVFMAALLFLSAGALDWPQGWIFLAIFIGASLGIGLWLMRTDPGLLAARMVSPVSADQRPLDRALVWGIMILFFAWIAFMPLDAKRFGWSHVPVWEQLLGGAIVVISFWGNVAVLRANSFAAVNVRVQRERNQTVVSSGPYAAVRHPMYSSVILLMIGTPLLLGSLWGLIGPVLMVPLLAARAMGEEVVLRDGLASYRDYTARVRYRLVPGLW